MNETTRIELKKCVERCVRPIRASYRRKDRMRAELLAHLVETFERELAAAANGDDALLQTIKRFGDAAAIRRELQQSVPWLERSLYVPLIGRKSRLLRQPGESALQYDLRCVSYGIVALVALVVISCTVRGWHFRSPTAIYGLIGTLVLAAIAAPCFILIGHAKRRALADGRASAVSSVAASLVTAAAAVLFTLALVALFNLTSNVSFLSLTNPWIILTPAVVAPVVLEIQSRLSIADARRFEEWDHLEIE